MISPLTQITFVIIFIIALFITILEFHCIDKYIKYCKKKKYKIEKALFCYPILFIGILLILRFIDVEILNELKNGYIIATICFIIIYDIIRFSLIKKITNKQFVKTMCILSIIWILLIVSIGVNAGYNFSSKDCKRQWESKYTVFEYDNESYNVSVHISSSVSNYKGFFVDTPISLILYESSLKFNEKTPPNNTKISIQIELFPHCYYVSNKTYLRNLAILDVTKINNNTYRINTPNKYWFIFYDYSGEKYLSSNIIINGTVVANSERVTFIEIEKGYVKSQVEMTRVITILTLWLVFIGLLTHINKSIEWLVETYPEKFREYKLKKYF